ncbi:tail fiber protein [Hyphomonas sp.]|jgi:microcystin-dependent protein|uniref:phage tail protein n=1 Tax=Hyphomonas sp. TaxID=87 RepID=UPI0032D8CB7C
MIQKFALTAALTGALMAGAAPAAHAGPDAYLGEIMTVGFNFCPRGTLEADGRLLPINENTALFSLLGTLYGGDGRTTFALPDLRGRVVVGAGQGPGLTERQQGARGGTESNIAGPALAHDGAANPLGDSTSGNNMPPWLALKHCVVTQGIYPSRS